MEDYGWIAAMLSFTVNDLLLLGTNRLTGHPPGGLRAAMAAALGAAHVRVCLVQGFAFLGGLLWRLVFLALMALVAFGFRKSTVRRGLVFGLLNLALEGIAVGEGFWCVVLSAVVIFALCLAVPKNGKMRYVPVSITHGGKTVCMMALVDTGNMLKDPISGRSVLIVDGDVGWQLLALDQQQLMHPIETLASGTLAGLRLIPYCAIGQPSGLLLGLRVDSLLVDGKSSESIVAFAPQTIGDGKTFRALAGGMCA